MNLVWKPLALLDREQIMDYIARDKPLAALELDELIEHKVDQLIERPDLYRAGRKRGTREMVVHPDYIVIYRVRKDIVEILRVKHTKHTAQQWP
ncbi:MAG: type II toxin-antitoxin system RelE/ParE family toxin [Collimonas sp.]|uniref:type II toxin-antitoxin system RelE/ParE family toxin n=1 Tax=Collimonas sp. TaxID=1963772 RepID=UPI0032661B60